jgi:aminoglycoside 2'-N-acetyltransferase I
MEHVRRPRAGGFRHGHQSAIFGMKEGCGLVHHRYPTPAGATRTTPSGLGLASGADGRGGRWGAGHSLKHHPKRDARPTGCNIGPMTEVRTAHTADLDTAILEAARALLGDVFEDLTEYDWEHALGGIHALVWEGPQLIGHASLIQRRLLHGGRALRTGYVEAVGVRADRRRRGHGAALMQALERVVRGAYDLGALGATDRAADFYARRGWKRWEGPTSAFTPTGITPTPEDNGGIYVFPGAVPLDLSGPLTCDWRDGDVW